MSARIAELENAELKTRLEQLEGRGVVKGDEEEGSPARKKVKREDERKKDKGKGKMEVLVID
jgi:hypothetical protein